MHRIIFIFFFLSGFSSLVFEVIWARMLQQVFGSSSFAISTLLTAFMAGLAIGSYFGGKLADRVGDQLRLYGILEACIGLYALLVPILLNHLPTLYSLLFEHFIDDFYLFSLLRFVAVFVILLIPTTLMGATLPLVSQWIADRQRLFQGSIGILYGINTLGACTGCALAGFLLLPTLGLSTTNSIFAAVNFALAIVVLATAHALRNSGQAAECVDDNSDNDEPGNSLSDRQNRSARSDFHPRWALIATLVAFAITGVVSMSYQVLWTRAYLITLGSSTYSFTLVLTAVLIGIALGSAAISPWVKRIRRPLFWFSLAQFGTTTTAILSFFTLNRIPGLLFDRIRDPITSSAEIYLFQFGLVAIVVFLPSLLQGMSFPLVIRAVTNHARGTGGDVGNAYAFNTTGAIVGSFAAGFVLLPWLGLQQAIAGVIILNLFVATVLAMVEIALRRDRIRTTALIVAMATAVGLYFMAPPLDTTLMTSGIFRAQFARDSLSPEALQRRTPEILYYQDGLTATTSVERQGDTITLRANGKPEASDGADMPTQIMVGLLPLVLRSGFTDVDIGNEDVAMIGFGSGVTAGASLQWPLKSLDVIEIEQTMVEASRFFEHVNHRPLDDRRMNLIESDGRNYIEYSPKTFDVIISEPSNPWIAGVSALFTVEFFARARQMLNENGVYAQWVQLYEMSPDNVRTVFETFRTVFPHVQAFSSRPKSTDIILIGSDRPLHFPADGYHRAWEIDSVKQELHRVGIEFPHDLHGRLFMNQDQLESFSAGAELNTDDNGLLEFSAPRDVIFYEAGDEFFARWYFTVDDYGDPRPFLKDWPDGQAWTAANIGLLARATWIAGKPVLAAQILADHGFYVDDPNRDTSATSVHHVLSVLAASERSPSSVIETHWPVADSGFHRSAKMATERDHRRDALNQLYEARPLDGDGYDGELGLYHAVLLTEGRDLRPALRQLEHLADLETFDDEPSFQLLRAHVLERRRRYLEAFDAYLHFSRLTASNSP